MTAFDMPNLYAECAPGVAAPTLSAIIQTESSFYPWSINVNGPDRLARQPVSRDEAIAWAQYLLERGYNADFGWMQINSANLLNLGLTVSSVFDPCANLRAGARILTAAYARAVRQFGTDAPDALLAALSIYNTGDPVKGLVNGYVGRVESAALTANNISAMVVSDTRSTSSAPPLKHVEGARSLRLNPLAAETGIEGFSAASQPEWSDRSGFASSSEDNR